MNAPTGKIIMPIDFKGTAHWQNDLPYRAIVPIKRQSADGPMLYCVAQSAQSPCGAEKALKIAAKKYGALCFYCGKKFAAAKDSGQTEWTLDHIEPTALGGKDHLQNLVISCKPCNSKKGHKPIDNFNPVATEKWLRELKLQMDERLKRLKTLHRSEGPI